MEHMCRICLTIGDKMKCELTEESDILRKLRCCVNFQINITENYPKSLCDKCYNKIIEFDQFKEQITQNENKILEMIQNNTLPLCKTEIQIKEEKENLNEDLAGNDYFESVDCSVYNNIEKKVKHSKKLKNKKLKTKLRNRVILFRNDNNKHDPLKCLMCFKSFESQDNLSKHYKTEHTFREQIDEKNDFSDKYLVLNVDNKTNYKCNSCGEIFENNKEILEHIKNHLNERPYICKLCGRTYMTVYAIVLHGRVHGGYKQYCSFGCGYSSPHGGALRDHERRHNNEHSYQCKVCGKGFMVKTWYEQHQNVHNNVKPFVCDFCGMAFHMHRYLMAHRNKIHPDLSAIRRYMCVHCNYTCENKMRLNAHVKMEHKKGENSITNHLCDICGKTFSRVEGLSNHKKIHFGIAPFVCGLCNKSFSKKYNLQVHMRVHNTDNKNKPQCNTCGKFFAQKSSLHRHIKRRHPNEL